MEILLKNLDASPCFTCTTCLSFDTKIDKFNFLQFLKDNNIDQFYNIEFDIKANRSQSKAKKKLNIKDSMYNNITLKRKIKDKNICLQISDNHCRIIFSAWMDRKQVLNHYQQLFHKYNPNLQFHAELVSANMSFKDCNRLDLFLVKNTLERIGRETMDFRVYFNPMVNNDKAVTVEFMQKRGKIRIFKTGTFMVLGVNDLAFFKEKISYLKQCLIL